jgi:hypothetical protein
MALNPQSCFCLWLPDAGTTDWASTPSTEVFINTEDLAKENYHSFKAVTTGTAVTITQQLCCKKKRNFSWDELRLWKTYVEVLTPGILECILPSKPNLNGQTLVPKKEKKKKNMALLEELLKM